MKASSEIAKSQSLVGHSKTAKCAMVPQIDSFCVDKKYSIKHIGPTPVESVNRFWPLIESPDDSEPKVVIGDFNDSVISQRQKCNKKDVQQSRAYNDIVTTSRSHRDTVGGDLLKWSKTLQMNNSVRLFKVPYLGSAPICPVSGFKNIIISYT